MIPSPLPPSPGRAEDGALQPCPSWALVITLISEQLGAPLSKPLPAQSRARGWLNPLLPHSSPTALPSRQTADLCHTKGKLFWTRGESAG